VIRFPYIVAFLILTVIPMMGGCNSGDHRERLAKHYRLEKPDGTGPFPAVMMVPGCSGFHADFAKGHYDGVQSRLVDLGFVTLRVNYLAARNADSCFPDIIAREVADDIHIAADYLRQQSFVKKGAINLIGWSFGAAAALEALGRTENIDPVQIAAVVVYYPYCREVKQKWNSEIPLLVLVGALDNIAPLDSCKQIFPAVSSDRLVIRVYKDAHHCFDFQGIPAEMQHPLIPYGTIGYNEAAAKAAWIEVTNFLRK
jgi:dienelactone hydrolase